MFEERIRTLLSAHNPVRIEKSSRTQAAVLIPLFEKERRLHILFTKRTDQVATHRGEICFPGGVMDQTDPDLPATALRELEEELALPRSSVEILGCLDEIRTAVSYFRVVPYVGFLKGPLSYRPNEIEVSEVLEIPLEHFTDPAIFHEEMRILDQISIPVYFYQWKNHTIWGVTGRILKSLLDLLKE